MGNFLLEQIYFLVPILLVIYLMLFATSKTKNRYKKENATHPLSAVFHNAIMDENPIKHLILPLL